MNILMVCLGNICRSPLAEGILRHKIQSKGLEWTVDSAGTGAWHIGEQPDQRSIEIAMRNGIDITGQRARQFGVDDFHRFDIILTMDASNYNQVRSMALHQEHLAKVDLLMNNLYPGKNIAVPDPYYNGGFEKVFEMIDAACNAFITNFENKKLKI